MRHEMTGLILLTLTLLTALTSCADHMKSIRYESVGALPDMAGTVCFAGAQLETPAVEWSESINSGDSYYSIPFNEPGRLLAAVGEIMPPTMRKKIGFQILSKQALDEFNEGMKQGNIYSYAHLKNFIPVFEKFSDRTNAPSVMDDICLKALNRDSKAEYYITFTGSIEDYSLPRLLNLFDFSLTPRLSIVIYDRSGNKVFAGNYTKKFDRIKEDYKNREVYYHYLAETVNQNQNKILEDMAVLMKLKDAGNENLDVLLSYLNSKNE